MFSKRVCLPILGLFIGLSFSAETQAADYEFGFDSGPGDLSVTVDPADGSFDVDLFLYELTDGSGSFINNDGGLIDLSVEVTSPTASGFLPTLVTAAAGNSNFDFTNATTTVNGAEVSNQTLIVTPPTVNPVAGTDDFRILIGTLTLDPTLATGTTVFTLAEPAGTGANQTANSTDLSPEQATLSVFIPEPASVLLLVIGVALLASARRTQQR